MTHGTVLVCRIGTEDIYDVSLQWEVSPEGTIKEPAHLVMDKWEIGLSVFPAKISRIL